MKYRKDVIEKNINRVFPEYTENQIRTLRNDFYLMFSRLMVEFLFAYAYPRELLKRITFEGNHLITDSFKNGKSVILSCGHFYNWEWLAITGGTLLPAPLYGIYKKLSNPYFEKNLYDIRASLGMNLVETREAKKFIQERESQNAPSLYILAADQSPPYLPAAIYFDFFGISTPFFSGIERFSEQYDMDVVYAEVSHPKKGHYNVTIKKLERVDGSYTRAFVQALESSIKSKPKAWLWSHNRWKHAKDQ